MELGIRKVFGVQGMHENQIKMVPNVLEETFEAAVLVEGKFRNSPCEEGGSGDDIASD